MHVVDANVLIYAVNEDASNHEPAHGWLTTALNGAEPLGLAWNVVLAFLRIVTNPSVISQPLTVDDALRRMQRVLDEPPVVILEPGLRHLDDVGALLRATGTGGNLVNDAHLAALAIRHDAEVVTYDRDFGRFPGVRWRSP